MNNIKNIFFNLLKYSLAAFLFSMPVGCEQGAISEKPPIHPNPNMDSQKKYKAQSASRFFADGRVNRLPVEGTVAITEGFEDTEFYFGKTADGKLLAKAPVIFDLHTLTRGQERFNIYCAPCHGKVGDGKGIVIDRGFVPPPTFHQDKIREYPDGQIFDVITNGFRNMPTYKHQIPVTDRWAIVGYVRALQRSQNASAEDVPQDVLTTLTTK